MWWKHNDTITSKTPVPEIMLLSTLSHSIYMVPRVSRVDGHNSHRGRLLIIYLNPVMSHIKATEKFMESSSAQFQWNERSLSQFIYFELCHLHNRFTASGNTIFLFGWKYCLLYSGRACLYIILAILLVFCIDFWLFIMDLFLVYDEMTIKDGG